MKYILVTGGAGFLGSNLCEKILTTTNDLVFCLDNLQTGSMQNISHLITNPKFRFVSHDICSPLDMQVDEIYNLACPASPKQYQADPIKTMVTNVLGTLNLLDMAKKYNAKFLQASTSEVYGDPAVHPQTESYWGNTNPVGIRSCYDEGKRAAETLCMDFSRTQGLKVKIMRIFNTYGPRMRVDDNRVVSNFIVQALTNQPITIYGDGTQTRSFCYVDDLLNGMYALMNSADSVTGPVNIGNPGEFTMLELAEKVIAMTGSKSEIQFCPLPQDDPKQRKPDISRAKLLLKWSPSVTLDDGLLKSIAYFKTQVETAVK